MIFSFSSFLWMLPLAAIPIIIHLLQRQRYVTVKFAATEFLRNAIQRTRRRVLLQDLLLLILRTLAVLLVIFALARPNTDTQLLVTAQAPQLEVVIIDGSMSMQQFVGDTTAFESARNSARNIFSELQDTRDRGALIIAGQRAQTLAIGNPYACLLATGSTDKAENANAAWQDALQMSFDAIAELAMTGSEIRLTILSDFQSNEWFSGSAAVRAMDLFSTLEVQINYQNVSTGHTANLAVIGADLSKEIVVKGESLSFSCQVHNYTSQPQQRLLQLLLDDKIIAEQQLDVLARGNVNFQHVFSPTQFGPRRITAKISADGLSADDQQSLGFEVVSELNTILCSNSSDFNNGDVSANFYGYLNLGDEAPLRPVLLGPHQLSSRVLSTAQLLILSDLSSLPTAKVKLIADFVADGGGLLVLVGPQSNNATLQQLMLELGIDTFNIGAVQQRDALLDIDQASHPALELFTDPQWQALLTEVPHRKFRQVDIGGDKVQQVLSFVAQGDDYRSQALVDFEHQRGRVAVLAAVPYAKYNRMPEVPGGTMALIYDLLLSLAPQPRIPSKLSVGQTLELAQPKKLVAPNGNTLASSARVPLNELGAYLVDAHTVGVHALVTESDLRSLDTSELPLNNSSAAANNDVEQQLETESTLGEILLLALLCCLVSESLLCHFIDRRRAV
ncbi:MAG: hypothetical protein ACI84O_000444 [Myxococcota bacterium]|jgi:hypothetical protein